MQRKRQRHNGPRPRSLGSAAGETGSVHVPDLTQRYRGYPLPQRRNDLQPRLVLPLGRSGRAGPPHPVWLQHPGDGGTEVARCLRRSQQVGAVHAATRPVRECHQERRAGRLLKLDYGEAATCADVHPAQRSRPGLRPAAQGSSPTATTSSCPELKLVTNSARPSGARAISRGKPPAGRYPLSAARPARASATSTTARVDAAPEALNLLESATTILLPLSTSARPTGASPTSTLAMSDRAGSVRSRAAENPSSRSLSRAVTQTTLPFAEVITRTGLQPASTVATTDAAGSVSARRRSMTVSVPPPAALIGPP